MKDHIVLIKNRWTSYTVVYPVPFTKDEADKFVAIQDKTNSIYEIFKLIQSIAFDAGYKKGWEDCWDKEVLPLYRKIGELTQKLEALKR